MMSELQAIEPAAVPSRLRLWLAGVLFAACCATGVVAGYYFGITRSLGVIAIILVACGFAAFGGLVADWLAEIFDRTQQKSIIANSAFRANGLAAQVSQLQLAIDSMNHGLCMFGPDRRLVVSNARYAELYGIPPELVRPGLTPAEILQHAIASATAPAASQTELARRATEIAEAGLAGETTVSLSDGRKILVSHTPLAGGGWVTTHQDIGDQRT
jgi:PAS domain-containing protein